VVSKRLDPSNSPLPGRERNQESNLSSRKSPGKTPLTPLHC
jgi:hypothetical protein